MRIIPAIDLYQGQCVRLEQGDYTKMKVYAKDPLDMAKRFEDAGLRYLHLVDLEGAKAGELIHYKVLEQLAGKTSLKIDFGGGLRNGDSIYRAFESGAQQVNVGSMAVQKQEELQMLSAAHGPERFILSADVRDKKVATHGWTEDSALEVLEFVQSYMDIGWTYTTVTDIAKDGMLQGPSTELYAEMQAQISGLKLIASGGIRNLEDVMSLRELNLDGAIIGKALYEGQITLRELEKLC